MITIDRYLTIDPKYEASYIEEVRTFNMISHNMNDDCKPHLESTACMIWVDENGLIGELECIYPIELEDDRGVRELKLEMASGIPCIRVSYQEKAVKLFRDKDNVILFLTDEKKPDKRCRVGNLIYYVTGNELIALECIKTKIV